MPNYDNNNRGVLFKEKDKKNEKAPDYKGSINVGGKEYKLAGWIRESKSGNKFLSLSIDTGGKRQAEEEDVF
jgi:uncharacterized protein (DUF736 family)